MWILLFHPYNLPKDYIDEYVYAIMTAIRLYFLPSQQFTREKSSVDVDSVLSIWKPIFVKSVDMSKHTFNIQWKIFLRL